MKRKQLAPHIHADQSAAERYLYVLVALLPAFFGAVFYFGVRVLILAAVSMFCFFVSDYLIFEKLYPELPFHVDYSSLVSGLLLVLMIPASTSFWAVILAALFGSVLVKQAFGGAGTNVFNPAFAARAFLEFACPLQMTAKELPFKGLWNFSSLLTGKPGKGAVATQLPSLNWLDILSGRMVGMAGVTSIVLLFFGLLILMERKLIRYEISIAYFATIVIGYIPFYWDQLRFYQFFTWMSLGGIMLVGIFALNDCTTTPMDPKGRIVFGFGTGVLTLVLYRFANSSYAMVFPILMMNMTTPIFDRYIRPRVFSKASWFREVKE
ncbi:MAG: RnfABCDGE type electron transport complex subunit D [Clostridiales bacterium]|nr:RnfABCDGE type electron transport complex subunit D [Clostridiales bacterium]